MSKPSNRKLSSFSVLLIMGALMVIGLGVIPLLSIQYTPLQKSSSINVAYSWQNASARIIEQEVTSKIESALATINGVLTINSISRKNGGNVKVSFKKGIPPEVARFEVASQIRQLYPSLPDGVSYPNIPLSVQGSQSKSILTYQINADLPANQIEQYINSSVLIPISQIDGVNDVRLSGATPYEYRIKFDPEMARIYGISGDDVATAVNSSFREDVIGNVSLDDMPQSILVKISGVKDENISSIPIKKTDDKIVYLSDIATVEYKEAEPLYYHRINGLNTINLTIYAEDGANILVVSSAVKERMIQLEELFPAGISARLSSDASVYIKDELHKIYVRTGLSLLILLIFVYVSSRKIKYLLIIFTTLIANLLVAAIFYKLLDLQIHLYSLAGVTVSLGIIIDTSIIMTDHYSYYRDKRVFTAILGALLTTIASLSIIFFLPDVQKENLVDFAMVIIINLTVSMIVSLLFIPSLLEKLRVKQGSITSLKIRSRRRVVIFDRIYVRFINWGRKHRWIYIIILVLGFGIPIHLMPSKLTKINEEPSRFVKLYDKVVGGDFYQSNRQIFEKLLGGSLRLFSNSTGSSSYYREPERLRLTINAGMPEGCTVHQLNEVVRYMENYLSQFDEIDMFETNVNSYNNSSIYVTFKPESEKTGFPIMLKNDVIQAAMNYGGATWQVYGIDLNGFSNDISRGYKSHRITLTGYNYDMLLKYAEDLVDSLLLNRRVSEPAIMGEVSRTMPENEYYIQYDKHKISSSDIVLNEYYNYLSQQLFNRSMPPIFINNRMEYVSLESSQKDIFDLWHVKNDMIDIDSTKIKLVDIGSIDKRLSGINIIKNNQSYQLTVAFDFIGSYELAQRVINNNLDRLNDSTLPMGYKAELSVYGLSAKDKTQQVWLILLIIAIIYFICAILFESLLKPLVIILMIPVSFIGVFLTFGLLDVKFDQGGFASFVLLCGITVNAGIYLINEYNVISRNSRRPSLNNYIKAYNRKITPIMLTIISTIIGLVPFLYDGKDDVFWYAFAMGAMGGMVMSIIALVVYMPIFMTLNRKQRDTM